MFFILAITGVAIYMFVREKVSLEVTSIALLTVILLFGQLFPVPYEDGNNALSAQYLLAGFANPSLIAVMALLVMGQALIHTDALRFVTNIFAFASDKSAIFAIYGVFLFVMAASAFINNTPLVVIAIPLIQVLASSAGLTESRMMMPLSFVAILGGMTTLIGSSTNLLVSSSLTELGYEPLEFFGFVVPGLFLAVIGLIYVVFILPKLLPDRSNMARELVGTSKEFIAELDIAEDSKLIGAECENGQFPALKNINVRMIQRGGHLILPPFEGYAIEAGDILITAATRKNLISVLSSYPGFFLSEENKEPVLKEEEAKQFQEERVLAEVMITPASRFMDMTMDQAGIDQRFGAVILGIQRRAKTVRRRLSRIRLEAGDVLLIASRRNVINSLRDNPDFIVLSGSKREMPAPRKAPLAAAIFLATIGAAALGFLSIPVAAITGSVILIATKCLNIRQAVRAMDRKIFLLVGSMLALGTAMQATGGALFIAEQFTSLPFINSTFSILAGLFLIIAISTNLLSNNACAVLFTPISMNLAETLQGPAGSSFSLSYIFAITVVFAANCSFASPIGYQTNLLVMGPGHYRFSDFVRAGVPLIIILWIAFMVLLRFYFGL